MWKFAPVVMTLALLACSKDKAISDKNAVGASFSDTNIRTLFKHLATAPQTYTLNSFHNNSIVSNKGTRISVGPHTFSTQAGTRVSDTVVIEVLELFSKKDMIINNVVPASTNGLMLPVGQVQIKAKKAGQQLNMDPACTGLIMPGHNIPSKQALTLYTGSEFDITSTNLNWLIHTSDVMMTQQDSFGLTGFYMNYDPGDKTTCTVHLTGPFDNSNTIVFLSMDGTMAFTALHASKNSISQKFVSSVNSIPIDATYTVIALCFDGRHFHYTLYPVKMTENKEIRIPALVQSTKNNILDKLSTL